MQRVYLLEQGSYLRKSGLNLALYKQGQMVEEIPAQDLEQLVLMGYTSLSGAVIDFLIKNRVETVFLSPKGDFRGRLNTAEHKDVLRRKNQYLRLSEPDFLLRTAMAVVQGKIRNQARFLAVQAQRAGSEEIQGLALGLRVLARNVAGAEDLQLLRGIEGHASTVYFRGLGGLIKDPALAFKHRSKRPPLDPANALLSFVYTLLTNEVLSAIRTVGLDPYLGALHEPAYGRPSLACDLVEEWRTYLGDRLVLGLLNRGSIKQDDFVYMQQQDTDFVDEEDLVRKRPVEMKPATRRALLEAYEKLMQKTLKCRDTGQNLTHRSFVLRQARNFLAYIQGELEEYQPFSLAERM